MNGAHQRTSAMLVAATVLLTVNPASALATVPPATHDQSRGTSLAQTPGDHCAGAGRALDRVQDLVARLGRHAQWHRRAAVPAPPGDATTMPGGQVVQPADQGTTGTTGTAGTTSTASTASGTTALDSCPETDPGAAPVTPSGSATGRLRSSGTGTPGTRGLGDSYFPSAGNGGYNVTNYDIRLRYFTPSRRVSAAVKITAVAGPNLASFNLDYRGPAITSVRVNGKAARYRRNGQELTVLPAAMLRAGRRFVVVVTYAGVPGPMQQPDLGTYGWVPSQDGAVVVSEPDGAPTWIPVNDHPRDKATYHFVITVPRSLQAVANGEQGRTLTGPNGTRTYVWTERSPMASYLATVAIGKFQFLRGKAGRIPVITAVDPRFATQARRVHDTTISVIKWESSMFGPYPFRAGGAIVDDPDIGYALETQTRPVYSGFPPSEDFIVHELAHQWFGDSVSVRDWRYIWLNEGFATYAEWLWRERHGGETAAAAFRRNMRDPANGTTFNPPPGRPGRSEMFANSVYVRGAMCLQALRERVGDAVFFRILRQWVAWKRNGNASTSDFISLSERLSGKQLDGLFRAWLYTSGKPTTW